MVRDAGLVPRVTVEHHNDVASGLVAQSDPVAGTEQLRGSEVDLVVSSGRPQVPAIAPGTDPNAASIALTAADLTVVVSGTPAFDDAVPAGAVLRTDPAAGTALTVECAGHAGALRRTPLPSRSRMSPASRPRTPQNKLTVAGFALGPAQKTFDPKAKPGSVLGSSPAAGTEVPKGTEVSLQIADALTVPDVRGTSTKDAVKTLEKAGFTVTVGDPAFDADIDSGDILRTDPGPGTAVDPNNAKIFLVPSNAITVPDLTDDSVRQAQQKLDKLGLELSVSSFFGGDDATIWNQSPGAGGRVEPGGTVSVTAFP